MIICDIDGTIADSTHRLHHLHKEPPDWDGFDAEWEGDVPIIKVIQIIEYLQHSGTRIAFLTGRRESHRKNTQRWLDRHVGIWHWEDTPLLMRKDEDERHDMIVKPEILKEHFSFDEVWFILEDRNCMVEEWRRLGYTCLQPKDGDY